MEASIDLFTGLVAAVVAGLLVKRVIVALQTGTVPLYKTRMTRSEAGEGKFFALVGLNALGAVAMGIIAADLLLGLGLRAR